LPDELGFLWFRVKVTDLDDSGYSLSDFISIAAELMYFSKEYKGKADWEIFEDNGIEYDDEGDPIFPEGEVRAVMDVLDLFGSYAYAIDEVYCPVYQINSRIFSRLIRTGSVFHAIKENGDDEFYVQVNLSRFSVDDLKSSLDEVKSIFEQYMYELGEEIEVNVSIFEINPKDPKMLLSIFRGKSELRKF